MTKVDIGFQLTRPLDEALQERLAKAQAIYGINRIYLSPDMNRLTVDYDASRLTPAQVASALHQAGIPASWSL
ncbi:MAG: hypothetical protein JJE04_02795 [Acidobacteriia bacterium]|nr:hypothetical protein [Terriglobia bacterium]